MQDSMKEYFKSVAAIRLAMINPLVESMKTTSAMQLAMSNRISEVLDSQLSLVESMKEVRESLLFAQPTFDAFEVIRESLNSSIQASMHNPTSNLLDSHEATRIVMNSIGWSFKHTDYTDYKRREAAKQEFKQVDDTLTQIVNELTPTEMKGIYVEMEELVKESEDLPNELVELPEINVYSVERFKIIAQQMIIGILVFLVSSSLTWDEIEKIMQNISNFLGSFAAGKSLTRDKEEKVIINNYNIYVRSDEEAKQVVESLENDTKVDKRLNKINDNE